VVSGIKPKPIFGFGFGLVLTLHTPSVGNIAKLLHGPPPSKERTKDKIQNGSSSCTGI